jgi:uncharacterized protein (DUF2336 family)
MDTVSPLITELENAINSGSAEWRVEVLRRVTDLFLIKPDRFKDDQINLFDDVLGRLIEGIEKKALAELSDRLAPIENAPPEAIRRLAQDEAIEVAGPVLRQSSRLSDQDLVEIAKLKGQAHLAAISARPIVADKVTDVLLQRGDRTTIRVLAKNSGAQFSDNGYQTLVKKSEEDDDLAEAVGMRSDIPMPLFRELLSRATESVRGRLMAGASPESQERIRSILDAISANVDRRAGSDYASAQRTVRALQQEGKLDEISVLGFVMKEQYAELVVGLSALCTVSIDMIERLLQSEARDALLVPCKAAGFAWTTVEKILKMTPAGKLLSPQSIEEVRRDYARLSQATAQRVHRFWQVRESSLGK